jgi:hypothetical protein
MGWQVHYRRGDKQFRAPAADRSTAVAVACILIRDGHDVVKLESISGETLETDEINAFAAVTPLRRWFRRASRLWYLKR